MNSFKQHIPNFVDCDKPVWQEFETTEQLLNLKIVKRYPRTEGSSYFAISGNCLMIIRNDGFSWWVVGYLKEPGIVDLPQWDGGKYRAEMPGGSIKILSGEEVVEVCGGILTLKDGTEVKKLS